MYFMFDHAHHHHEHSICHPSVFRTRITRVGRYASRIRFNHYELKTVVWIWQAGIMTPYSLARSTKHVERELPSILAPKKHSKAQSQSTMVGAKDLGHAHVKEPKSALAIHAITVSSCRTLLEESNVERRTSKLT